MSQGKINRKLPFIHSVSVHAEWGELYLEGKRLCSMHSEGLNYFLGHEVGECVWKCSGRFFVFLSQPNRLIS